MLINLPKNAELWETYLRRELSHGLMQEMSSYLQPASTLSMWKDFLEAPYRLWYNRAGMRQCLSEINGLWSQVYENVSLRKLPLYGRRVCEMWMWKIVNQDCLWKRGPLFEQVFKFAAMRTQMWNPMPQGELRVGS